jgi:hypothetical protein
VRFKEDSADFFREKMPLVLEARGSYLARVTFAEASMLLLTMWFGLLWSEIAPFAITPGMTQEQVRAIVGRPGTFVFNGSVNSDKWTDWYAGRGFSVHYTNGVVESVSRQKQ